MKISAEIKKAIDAKKVLIGSSTVIKQVKLDKLSEVILASNCPQNIKKEIERNALLSKIDIKEFEGDSVELGAICKKPFKIAVIGIK